MRRKSFVFRVGVAALGLLGVVGLVVPALAESTAPVAEQDASSSGLEERPGLCTTAEVGQDLPPVEIQPDLGELDLQPREPLNQCTGLSWETKAICNETSNCPNACEPCRAFCEWDGCCHCICQ